MAYIVMAYVVIGYIVMAYVVIAYIVMVWYRGRFGPFGGRHARTHAIAIAFGEADSEAATDMLSRPNSSRRRRRALAYSLGATSHRHVHVSQSR